MPHAPPTCLPVRAVPPRAERPSDGAINQIFSTGVVEISNCFRFFEATAAASGEGPPECAQRSATLPAVCADQMLSAIPPAQRSAVVERNGKRYITIHLRLHPEHSVCDGTINHAELTATPLFL